MGTRHGVHSDGKWIRVSAGGGGLGEKVLSHRGAITREAVHAVDALEKAFARYVLPDIGDTGQGSQFTAGAFTGPCWTGASGYRWTARKLAR